MGLAVIAYSPLFLHFTPSEVKIGETAHKYPYHHLEIGQQLPWGLGRKESGSRLWSLEARLTSRGSA